jgi:hypothetical protein
MEHWIRTTDEGLIIIADENNLRSVGIILPKPIFQHSIIPIFQAFDHASVAIIVIICQYFKTMQIIYIL